MLVACTLPNPTRRQWQKSEQLLCQHRSYATSQRRAANESTIFPVLHLAGPQVRVAVLGGGDGVAAEGVGEDEEDAGEELEVGELLRALPGGVPVALDFRAGVPAAPLREHRPVEREGRLVEPQALQGDEHAAGEVGGEARREERPEDGGGDAEPDEHDEEVVVVPLQPLVRGRVEVEEHQLGREGRRREQAQRGLRQGQVPDDRR